jgi:restriction system protein
VQAKVLSTPRRGYFQITERGQKLHSQGHERIDVKILKQFPEFVEFHTSKSEKQEPEGGDSPAATPEEVLQQSYLSIRNELAADILSKIKDNSPQFFENLVVDLMVSMGYGGSRSDAGKSIGRSGDEGIDGIIKEDRLGLDVIYLQAKRWEGTVGRPEIQKFVGALHGKRAKKGVFITTGKFSDDATKYVETIDPRVILIDGRLLAEYMIDFNLGTSTSANFEIKKIDTDYFSEE